MTQRDILINVFVFVGIVTIAFGLMALLAQLIAFFLRGAKPWE